jgi:hypothetical protein
MQFKTRSNIGVTDMFCPGRREVGTLKLKGGSNGEC